MTENNTTLDKWNLHWTKEKKTKKFHLMCDISLIMTNYLEILVSAIKI